MTDISFGLYAASGPDPASRLEILLDHAGRAERCGFDGVTVAEHHGGFPGYYPQPVLVANWILGATERVWSGPFPLLLSVRNPVLVAEEVAWTAARFPGRVKIAVVSGYAKSDFEFVGEEYADRRSRFDDGVAALAATLNEAGRADLDPAIRAWRESSPPLFVGANSRTAVDRAARLGLAVFFPSGEAPERIRDLIVDYRRAGGRHRPVYARNIWIGRPPPGSLERFLQIARSAAAPGMRQREGLAAPLLSGSAEDVVAHLAQEMELLGEVDLNLRCQLPGVDPDDIGMQIELIGTEVLPRLRASPHLVRDPAGNRPL